MEPGDRQRISKAGFVFKSSDRLETSEEQSAERRGGYYQPGKAGSLQLNCKQQSSTREIICPRRAEPCVQQFEVFLPSPGWPRASGGSSQHQSTSQGPRTGTSDTEGEQMDFNSLNWITQVLLNGIFSSAGISNPVVFVNALLSVRFPHPPSLPWDLTSLLWAWISSFNLVSASSTELIWAQKNPITVVREGE